jgi:hypothetical protein
MLISAAGTPGHQTASQWREAILLTESVKSPNLFSMTKRE